jgi:hypothetical protein
VNRTINSKEVENQTHSRNTAELNREDAAIERGKTRGESAALFAQMQQMEETIARLNSRKKLYDPLIAPDPEEWLSRDIAERIELVRNFHRVACIHLPDASIHSLIHVVVENQIAEREELPARRTAQRLMAEGLDRHEAVHAIGSALAEHIYDLLRGPPLESESNTGYFAALERLSADDWRNYLARAEARADFT